MSPKLKIVKTFFVIIFLSLVIIILLDIFNNGQYSTLVKLMQQNNVSEEFLKNNDDFNDMDSVIEYSNKEPSNDELLKEFESKLPNVPFAYSLLYNKLPKLKNYKCALFPDLKTLNYYNDYWQTYNIKNITVQLFGAYYDDRTAIAKGSRVVRILAMINQIKAPFPTTYCQIWYEHDRQPVITNISEYKLMWYAAWGNSAGIYYPYLLTCAMPKESNITAIPKAVTIAENKCDKAKNALKVIYDKPDEEKEAFAVCVKGLDFPYADIATRLVEWLEMMRLLGAHKIYFHQIASHPNVSKVLNYYQEQGFVEVQPISSVGGIVGLPHLQHWLVKPTLLIKRLNELIPYNECFYRNMYKYKYIALIDIDEVIMPLGNLTTWHDLVTEAKKMESIKKCPHGFAALCVRNIYFPYKKDNFTVSENSSSLAELPSEEIPSYMFMLKRQYRIPNHQPNGYNTKCLHNTDQALTLHNHYPFSWLNSCRSLDLSNTTAQLQHYHDLKPDKKYKELVLDSSIERFKSSLILESTKVLRELKLLYKYN